MPIVNIYTSGQDIQQMLEASLPELRETLARELTCGERALKPNEISIRIISVNGRGMIAPLEVEINAHAYGERIPNADKICLAVRQFMMHQITTVNDIRVWLILSELGHSWEE